MVAIEELEELPEPRDILELQDGQSIDLTPLRYAVYKFTIHPVFEGIRTTKVIRAVRIWVPREEKPFGAPYWDITPSLLTAELVTILPKVIEMKKRLRIQARGKAPKKRFSVTII